MLCHDQNNNTHTNCKRPAAQLPAGPHPPGSPAPPLLAGCRKSASMTGRLSSVVVDQTCRSLGGPGLRFGSGLGGKGGQVRRHS